VEGRDVGNADLQRSSSTIRRVLMPPSWHAADPGVVPLDIRTTPRFAPTMRIGELAREVGVSTDTVRFYERAGWLPRASRRDNA
jgi:hypothetical protein